VYLSLPAVLGIDGVRDVLSPQLDDAEVAALQASAAAIGRVQAGLEW
jgi:malate/lactate dehydrogenase